MKLRNFFKYTLWKIDVLNKCAQNPFTKKEYSYNPFESIFSRTYVWIEEENKKRKL